MNDYYGGSECLGKYRNVLAIEKGGEDFCVVVCLTRFVMIRLMIMRFIYLEITGNFFSFVLTSFDPTHQL